MLSSSAYDATLFCKSSNPSTESTDIQIGLFCSPGDETIFYSNLKHASKHMLETNQLAADAEGILMVPTLLHMRNRGEIVLASSDPFVHPKIYPKYLDNEEDRRAAAESALLCMKLMRTKPMADLFDPAPVLPPFLEEKYKGNYDSPELWREYFRHYGVTLYHPT